MEEKLIGVDVETGIEFQLHENLSLLQAIEKSRGNVIKVGCRGGGCGLCKVRIVSGEYEVGKMSAKHILPKDLELGNVLACRCFPRGNIVFKVIKTKRC